MGKITYPQGKKIKEGGNQFVRWLKLNKIDDDPFTEQMRLYRSIWNSAWKHGKQSLDTKNNTSNKE